MKPPGRVECLLLDLDDCLYQTPAIPEMVSANIRRYMHQWLGIQEHLVQEMCLDYYLNFGTTLAGLVAHGYHIDYDDWHAFVHGTLPYDEYIKADPQLKTILDSLPQPKYVFTNADQRHAERCLALLGIAECFRGVICFENTMEAAAEAGLVKHGRPVVCKPNRQAFEIALRLAGGPERTQTVFCDDSTRNVTSGHNLGIFSVLIGRTGVDCAADLQLKSLHELPAAMPWLWGPADGEVTGEKGAGGAAGGALAVQRRTQEAAVFVQA